MQGEYPDSKPLSQMFKLKCIVAVLTSYPVHFGGLVDSQQIPKFDVICTIYVCTCVWYLSTYLFTSLLLSYFY